MKVLIGSLALRRAVAEFKLSRGVQQYKLALQTGFNPNFLSGIIHGAVTVKREDRRVRRLCNILGLSVEEAFEEIDCARGRL
jgi:diphthamide synthase (EF-2-diphthine--ammonia ligase)